MPRYWCAGESTGPCSVLTHGLGCSGDAGVVTRVPFTQGGVGPMTTLSFPQAITSQGDGTLHYSLASIASVVNLTTPTYVRVTPGEDGISLDFTHPVIYVPPAAVDLWKVTAIQLIRTETGTQLCPFAGTIRALGGATFTTQAALVAAADAQYRPTSRYVQDAVDPCLIRVVYRPDVAAPSNISVTTVGVTSTVRLVEAGTGAAIACPAHLPIWFNGVRYATLTALGNAVDATLAADYSFVGVGADQCSLSFAHSSAVAPPAGSVSVWATTNRIVPVTTFGANVCPPVFPLELANAPGPTYANMTALAAARQAQLGTGYEVSVFDACQLRITYRLKDAVPAAAVDTIKKRWVHAQFRRCAGSAHNGNPAPQLQEYYLFNPADPFLWGDIQGAGSMMGGNAWPAIPQPMILATFMNLSLLGGADLTLGRYEKLKITVISPYNTGHIMLVTKQPIPSLGVAGQSRPPEYASQGIDTHVGYAGFVAHIGQAGTTIQWDISGVHWADLGIMISAPLLDASTPTQFMFRYGGGTWGIEVFT